jgi:hypothetical protein
MCYNYEELTEISHTLFHAWLFIRDVLSWDFLSFKVTYDITFKYITDFMGVGIDLLNIWTRGTFSGHTGDPAEHTGLFFHKVAYLSFDAPSKIIQTSFT